MFVIPALTALFAFIYVRPHEVFDLLRHLTFLPIVGIVVFASVLDVRLGVWRPRLSMLFVLGAAFFLFSTIDLAIKAPDTLPVLMPLLSSSFITFWLVTQSMSTFHAVEAGASVLLALTLLVAAIGVQQGLTPEVCFYRHGGQGADTDLLDGRPCARREDCNEGGIPGTDYLCEHPGLWGTHSIGGRIRYRGFLQDPNELSWAVGMGAPLAFALYERRRSKSRLLVLLVTLALGAVCTIMTKSRAGQLTFVAVLGVYFVRRFRWRGVAAALLVSAPVLFLGGRSGAEAEESTGERLEAWAEGLQMWRENPFLGVGPGQFTEHHYLTAHSSLVLTLAEMGPLGFLLWTATVYTAFKNRDPRPDRPVWTPGGLHRPHLGDRDLRLPDRHGGLGVLPFDSLQGHPLDQHRAAGRSVRGHPCPRSELPRALRLARSGPRLRRRRHLRDRGRDLPPLERGVLSAPPRIATAHQVTRWRPVTARHSPTSAAALSTTKVRATAASLPPRFPRAAPA